MKRVTLIVLLFLLSGAKAQSAPIAGVVLQSVAPGQKDGEWIAHIVNVSHKQVAAVNISPDANTELTLFYGDRTPFSPGETKDIVIGAEPGKIINPVVDLVVYADDTAEVANERAFKHVIRMHEEAVLTMQKEVEILAKLAGSSSRAADTAAELERIAAGIPPVGQDDNPHLNARALRQLAQDLKAGTTDPESATKKYEEDIQREIPHTKITRITGGAL